jgi:hypothetical protein
MLIYLFIYNSIIAHQQVRAFWQADNPYPVCSAIDNKPIVDEPISPQCQGCPESIIGNGKCKPKIRLWMLVEKEGKIKSYIMNLSPTSIRSSQTHLLKLKRSNLPLVAIKTAIELEDTKRNGFRWAICTFDVSGTASGQVLEKVKNYRQDLKKLMGIVPETDFEDPGDKVSS